MHGALSRSPPACFDSDVLLRVQDFRMFFVVIWEVFQDVELCEVVKLVTV